MVKNEFYEKYGDVFVAFDSYYKYTFTYKSDLDNNCSIYCLYGRDSGSIYRHNVNTDRVKLSDLEPNYAYLEYPDGSEECLFDDNTP